MLDLDRALSGLERTMREYEALVLRYDNTVKALTAIAV